MPLPRNTTDTTTWTAEQDQAGRITKMAAEVLRFAENHNGRLPDWMDELPDDEWDRLADAVRQLDRDAA